MELLRRGAVPGIAVIAGFALQLSDIDQPLRGNLSNGLWALAVIWALLALVTSDWFKGLTSESQGRADVSEPAATNVDASYEGREVRFFRGDVTLAWSRTDLPKNSENSSIG